MEQMYNRRPAAPQWRPPQARDMPRTACGEGIHGEPESVPNAEQPLPKKAGKSPENPQLQKNKSRKCGTYPDSDRVRSAAGTIC